MKIKYISFDFWNTLFNGKDKISKKRNKARILLIKNFLNKKNYNISKDKLSSYLDKTWEYFHFIWKNQHKTLSTSKILKHLFKNLEITINENAIKKLAEKISSMILNPPPKLTEKYLKKYIPELSKSYKLFIVSDTGFSSGNSLRKILKKNNLYQYFDKFSFSNEVGISKPSSEIFYRLLKNKKESKKLIHIGDLIETDILGANKIEAISVQYTKIVNKTSKLSTPDYKISSWKQLNPILKKL